MQNDTTLLVAAHTATSAAHALAESTKATRHTKRLTVADHADALDALGATIAALTGNPGVLRSTLRVIMERRDFPADSSTRADHALTRSLADLWDTTDHAHVQASRAHLAPAHDRLRGDLGRLLAIGSPAAGAGPARNLVAARAREATELIMRFGGRIHPDRDSFEDLVTALAGATDIVGSLHAACLHEAKRIEFAYQGTALGRSATIASETVTAASHALATAHHTLSSAVAAACTLADRASRTPGSADRGSWQTDSLLARTA